MKERSQAPAGISAARVAVPVVPSARPREAALPRIRVVAQVRAPLGVLVLGVDAGPLALALVA